MKKLFLVLLVLFSTSVWGADVTLQWDANPETDNVGKYEVRYKLEVDTEYTASPDVGLETQHMIAGLEDDAIYDFSVRAVGANGLPSAWSADIDNRIPGVPGGCTIIKIVNNGGTIIFER